MSVLSFHSNQSDQSDQSNQNINKNCELFKSSSNLINNLDNPTLKNKIINPKQNHNVRKPLKKVKKN